jgi:hypothetical protein
VYADEDETKVGKSSQIQSKTLIKVSRNGLNVNPCPERLRRSFGAGKDLNDAKIIHLVEAMHNAA